MNYGFSYVDDRGVEHDFLGRKSFIFATVKITANNLSGSVACPVDAADVVVINSVNANYFIDTSSFKTFDVTVLGNTVNWNCTLIQGATIAAPEVTLLCIAKA